MVDRIFGELDVLSDAIKDRKNDYLQKIQQTPPPWTEIQKVSFNARVQRLQKDLDTWDEHIGKIRSKANSMRNDDSDKAVLFFRMDSFNRLHQKLIDDITMIVLEGNGYLALNGEPVSLNATAAARNEGTVTVPHINLPKFNGDYLKWYPFWQRFEHAVHSKAYPKIEKLISLLGFLEGRALEEVEGFTVSEENYDTVVETLVNCFGKKPLIIKELQTKLRNIKSATSSPESLRTSVNLICNLCRQLQNLGVNVDNYSMKMDVIDKLPYHEKEELNWLLVSEPETATIEELMKRMKDMALRAELAPKYKTQNYFEGRLESASDSYNIEPHILKPNELGNNNKCNLCDGYHLTSNCKKFISPEEKIKELRKRNYCTNCSRKNHDTRSCNAKLKCNICEGNHYPYLCTTKNFSTAFVSVGKKQGSLLTKEVTIVNPVTKETAEIVVIFDSGTQQSYISNKLIDKLKLIQKEKLHIIGFNGKKSYYNSSLVKFQIKTIDGCKEIFANSTQNITATVPVTAMVKDNSTVYKKPDILIGMDYFLDIINSFEKRGDNLYIVNSSVGQIVCKNTPKLHSVMVTSLANEKLPNFDKDKTESKTQYINRETAAKDVSDKSSKAKEIQTSKNLNDEKKCHQNSKKLNSQYNKKVNDINDVKKVTTDTDVIFDYPLCHPWKPRLSNDDSNQLKLESSQQPQLLNAG
uniref:Peptidase aspartic putative domain-containing protein n=1 Tax=Panagrolaimus sp. PS1159 TaxID=55785 RepID=A0AC35GHM8_9BILA